MTESLFPRGEGRRKERYGEGREAGRFVSGTNFKMRVSIKISTDQRRDSTTQSLGECRRGEPEERWTDTSWSQWGGGIASPRGRGQVRGVPVRGATQEEREDHVRHHESFDTAYILT